MSVVQEDDKTLLNSIDEAQKFEMDGGLVFEYSPSDNSTENMTWRVGDEKGTLDKAAVWMLAFIMSNEEMRQKLVPIKTQEIRTFRKMKKIRLTRDCKAGTEIMVPFRFTIPLEQLVRAELKSGFLIPQ